MARGAFQIRPKTLRYWRTCVERVKQSIGWMGYCPDLRAGRRTRRQSQRLLLFARLASERGALLEN